ncbi:MAG: hypothetical protein IJM91_02155 [Lachnospiraceae bacterium]|nr:hypothetical protein [Lachnospiraceae bacterium]
MNQIINEDAFGLDDMIAELEEYYEAAGFADYYNRVLKDMSEEEIRKYFHETFFNSDDPKDVAWREGYFVGRI